MATRLYLPPSGGSPGITPTPATEWDFTTGFARVVPSVLKTNTAFSTLTVTDATGTSNRDALAVQYVYPLATGSAFTSAGTIKGRVLVAEGSNASNLRSQVLVRVIASDGSTVQATLYAGDLTTATGNPTSEFSTTLTNRQMPRGTTVGVAVNYTSVAGDYLVIEVGYRKHAAASTTGTLRFGDNNATDLAENETTTADNNSWIEFSNTFPMTISPPLMTATATVPTPEAQHKAGGSSFIPTQTYTGSESTTLQSYDSNWVPLSGSPDFVISNINTLRSSTGNDHRYYNDGALPLSTEYDVRADIVFKGSSPGATLGVFGRGSNAPDNTQANADGYRAAYDGEPTGWRLLKIIDNAATSLGTWFESFPSNTTRALEFRVRDDTKKMFIAGTERISSTDNALSAAGKVGVYTWNNNASNTVGIHLDNVQAQDTTGTDTVTIAVPVMTATAAVVVPTLQAQEKPPAATATAAAASPLAGLLIPVVTATAAVVVPTLRASVQVPVTTATASVAAPTLALLIPVATASATVPTPAPNVPLAVPALTATAAATTPSLLAQAQVPAAAATGAAASPVLSLLIPTATATANANDPAIPAIGAVLLGIPVSTATASAVVPTLRASVATPISTATSAIGVPSLSAALGIPASTASAAATTPLLALPMPVSSATALALTPIEQVTINVPVSTASAVLQQPTIPLTMAVPVATAIADMLTPADQVNLAIPIMTASAAAIAPTASAVMNIPAATAAGAAVVPAVVIGLAPATLTAAGTTLAPTLRATIQVSVAAATADVGLPQIPAIGAISFAAPLMTANATVLTPTLTATQAVPAMTADADAFAPDFALSATIFVDPAEATADAFAPVLSFLLDTAYANADVIAPTMRVILIPSVAGAVATLPEVAVALPDVGVPVLIFDAPAGIGRLKAPATPLRAGSSTALLYAKKG